MIVVVLVLALVVVVVEHSIDERHLSRHVELTQISAPLDDIILVLL